MRKWLASLFARLAGWLAGPELQPFVPPTPTLQPPAHTVPRFKVARWVGDKHWYAYEGQNGGDARRVFEQLIHDQEPGRAEFWMNVGNGTENIRGTYKGKA